MGDFRLALGMEHPHDVIEQMDLDVAMTGVFVSCCPAFARSGEDVSSCTMKQMLII